METKKEGKKHEDKKTDEKNTGVFREINRKGM